MKRVPRTIAAAVLLGALSAIPFVGSATAAAKAPKTVTTSASKSTLAASGGSVTIRATVKSAKTCAWSVSPKVKGFDASVKCAAKLSRVAKLPANTSLSAKRFTFSLDTVSGKVKASGSTVVSEKGKAAKSTTTTVPPTTTTTVPPTTTTTVPPLVQTLTTLSASVGGFYPTFTITAQPIMVGSGLSRPGVNSVSITMIDTANGQTIGTWTNLAFSSLVPDPTLVWDIVYSGATDTLTLDPSLGSRWSGPSPVTISYADLIGSYIGITATYSGSTGYASSTSSTVPI